MARRQQWSSDPQDRLRVAAEELASSAPDDVAKARARAGELLWKVSAASFTSIGRRSCSRLFHRGAPCPANPQQSCGGAFDAVISYLLRKSLGLVSGAESAGAAGPDAIERFRIEGANAAHRSWLAKWSSRTDLDWAEYLSGMEGLGGFATEILREWNGERGLKQRFRPPTATTNTVVLPDPEVGYAYAVLTEHEVAAAGQFEQATPSSYRSLITGLGLRDLAHSLGMFEPHGDGPNAQPVMRWMEALFWDACQTVLLKRISEPSRAIDPVRVAAHLTSLTAAQGASTYPTADRRSEMIRFVEEVHVSVEDLWAAQWPNNFREYIVKPRSMTRQGLSYDDVMERNPELIEKALESEDSHD